MIPLKIEQNIDLVRQILIERLTTENQFNIQIIDNTGARCSIDLTTNQILELYDNIGIMVFGNGQ
jgi:hypothetical protein